MSACACVCVGGGDFIWMFMLHLRSTWLHFDFKNADFEIKFDVPERSDWAEAPPSPSMWSFPLFRRRRPLAREAPRLGLDIHVRLSSLWSSTSYYQREKRSRDFRSRKGWLSSKPVSCCHSVMDPVGLIPLLPFWLCFNQITLAAGRSRSETALRAEENPNHVVSVRMCEKPSERLGWMGCPCW